MRTLFFECKHHDLLCKHNIILNSVLQHNYFITEGNNIGYMFRLLISHLQAYFGQLSHKMLCTIWDPIPFPEYKHGGIPKCA